MPIHSYQLLCTIRASRWRRTYCLCDVVYYYSAVGVAVVHGRQRLVPLLSRCVPNLKLDCSLLVECNCLREEGGADGRFPVVVKLILSQDSQRKDLLSCGAEARYMAMHTLTNRSTSELLPTADSPAGTL